MYKLFEGDLPDSLELTGDVAIDTETIGLNIKRDRLCLVQIADSEGKIVFVKFSEPRYDAPNLARLLASKDRRKIFHFARFDVAVLKHYLGISEIPGVFCTKIASKIARTYTDFHGLKAICRELLGVSLDKESQTSNWSAPVLSEKQLEYAMSDVLYLHKLRDVLTNMLVAESRLLLAEGAFSFLNSLCDMDLAGFDFQNILNH